MSAKKAAKQGPSKEKDDNEPGSWECTVCTFRNKYEAFKCEICDTRKGTSTRKPRVNQNVVQQQALAQSLVQQQEKAQRKNRSSDSKSHNSPESTMSGATSSKAALRFSKTGGQPTRVFKRRPVPFKDSLVVRSSPKKRQVTAAGTTVTITEFKPRTSARGRKRASESTKQ
ncbi:YY1-associated factor 2 [Aphelenchoides avenae]|nr:YY1-associated factor 2 [Aphelenchus avenae]